MSCDVGHRCGLDLALLWLWHRLAAVAPTKALAWEPPYAEGVALETNKQTTTTKKDKKNVCSAVVGWLFVENVDCIHLVDGSDI